MTDSEFIIKLLHKKYDNEDKKKALYQNIQNLKREDLKLSQQNRQLDIQIKEALHRK